MFSDYYLKNDDQNVFFYRFLMMLIPLVSVVLLFILWKLYFFVVIHCIIRKKKLNIKKLRNNYNLFLESYVVYNFIKNANDDDEIQNIILRNRIENLNPHNFNVNYDESIENGLRYDNISIDSIDSNYETDKCSICLSDIDKYIFVELDCNHKFHLKCLNKWAKKSNQCPLCKRIIYHK